ncbi:MAG: hypothetical protein ACK4GN_14040 [Runella sp.]
MKKILFIICLINISPLYPQVSTNPNSIGIGQNTNSVIPLHINKNGELIRVQGNSPYISFWEGNNYNGFIQAFSTSLGIGTKNSRDLIFYINDAPKMSINGNTGNIKTENLLHINGGLALTSEFFAGGNSGASGQILYSSGPGGAPYWGPPPPPKYAVAARNNSGQTMTTPGSCPGPQCEFILNFPNEVFDDGNLLSGGVFTAKHTGVYLVKIRLPVHLYDYYSMEIDLKIYKNASSSPIDVERFSNIVGHFVHPSSYNFDRVIAHNTFEFENIYKLNTNDTLTFKLALPGYKTYTFFPRIFIYSIY